MKLVINKCFGGFGLSHAAIMRYGELRGLSLEFVPSKKRSLVRGTYWLVPAAERLPILTAKDWRAMPLEDRRRYNGLASAQSLYDRDIDRADPALVQVVEELGDAASDDLAKLRIVEIPDGTDWEIDEYDGMETVREKHRSWG